jgi:hypothetical protein
MQQQQQQRKMKCSACIEASSLSDYICMPSGRERGAFHFSLHALKGSSDVL